MTLAAKAYITFIVALGAAAGVRGYLLWNPQDLVRFYCYLALAVPASCLKVRLPGVLGTMSVLFVFQLAAIVELGLPETLIMSAVCAIVQSYWRPKSKPLLVHVVFSVALLSVVATAGHIAYEFDGLQIMHGAAPFRLALLASVLFLTNTYPVAAVIALTENKQLSKVWKEFYSWTFPTTLWERPLSGCSDSQIVLSAGKHGS